ncbi:Deoxyguanosinetriphosphate triphosphohydrolase-like protein [Bienertia sinuspersici]
MAPTNTQRLEQVEGELAALRTSASEQVAAVSTASQELQQTLTTQIAKSLEEATQKLGEDLSMRLEGRITRSRENQEVMITQLRQEHVALRDEVRKTLSAGQKNGESSIGGGSNFELREKEVNDGSFDGGGANWRYKKLDLPLFDGTNPDGWILRAERYFKFYRLSEEKRLEAAVVALEGDALLWFEWENKRKTLRCWEELKRTMAQSSSDGKCGRLSATIY